MALEEPKDGDEMVKTGDFNFAVDGELKNNYGKFTVDYTDNWLRRGFSVIPDRAVGGC